MQKKLYIYFFWAMDLAALIALVYLILETVSVNNAIAHHKEVIPFDSGAYFLLLLSVFWLFTCLEYMGLRKGRVFAKKYSTKPILLWFITAVILAFFIPWYLENRFEESGYRPCDDPKEIQRISLGKSLIYKKGPCGNFKSNSKIYRGVLLLFCLHKSNTTEIQW